MSAIAILHEDAGLLAVSKPSGLPTVPARNEALDLCLHRQLEAERGERLWVVHRLDREASGVVVFGRSAEAHRELCLAFERREVGKTYSAFVAGELSPGSGRIDVALHDARRGKSRPALPGEPGRREAATEYATRARWSREGRRVSWLEARPLTGRHHQIRVHLRSQGTPILFDPLYGGGAAAWPGAPCQRLALHAERLTLRGGSLSIEAPLAADLLALRAFLEGA